ncbi:MAG: 16S rRNA (adenine(1518)-N(6)/adenine(1519)-N(6))-dimethyltransferase RsmA [Thermofilaceae archaeon]
MRPKKRLGQNFIVSRGAVETLLKAAKLQPGYVVYEIGAGLGTLTQALADKGTEVMAIEVDYRLIKLLNNRFKGSSKISIIHADALRFPIPRVERVISNVPYNISSQLIVKLLREPAYELASLTLQREFALRLIARPRASDYGRISVITQLYSEMEIAGSVSRKAFYPEPEVDSLIVNMKPRKRNVDLFNTVEKLTALVFSQRKRKLSKVLRNMSLDPNLFQGIVDLDKRVFELEPLELLAMAKVLKEAWEIRDRSRL